MKPIKKSVVYRTSAATDVLNSNNILYVTGLNPVPKKDIYSIKQINYRTETVQVYTLGGSWVPTASTLYSLEIYDPNRRESGYEESEKIYGQLTPPSITTYGVNAAAQRETIIGLLVAKINAQTGQNHAVAASLGGGTGMTITDTGTYYPVRSQTMSNILGANLVLPRTNRDGTGLVSTDITLTTAAVTSFGVGSILATERVVIDAMFGNLISGDAEWNPLTTSGLPAFSGQNYDGFEILSLSKQDTPSITGHYSYIDSSQIAYVDNGTGSSVTNLAGFLAFERKMHKEMAQCFSKDQNSITEFFDKGYVMQANPGITPYTGTIAGTADVMKFFTTPYGTKLEQYNINAQTIFAPLEVDAGLRVEQDVNATDGAHYCGGTLAFAPNSFVVGKKPFMCWARVVAGDWTDAFFMVGFRKKAVYAADYTTYDDLGAIGTQVSAVGDFVATQGNINNGTTKETVSTTVIALDTVSVLLMVKVAIDGTVTAYRNGVSFPIYSAGTTQLVFDAGDEMIPFFQYINLNSSASTLTFSELVAIADNNVIS